MKDAVEEGRKSWLQLSPMRLSSIFWKYDFRLGRWLSERGVFHTSLRTQVQNPKAHIKVVWAWGLRYNSRRGRGSLEKDSYLEEPDSTLHVEKKIISSMYEVQLTNTPSVNSVLHDCIHVPTHSCAHTCNHTYTKTHTTSRAMLMNVCYKFQTKAAMERILSQYNDIVM